MTEVERLLSDEKTLELKRLSQVIGFLGDGKLKNGDDSFRKFLTAISNDLLIRYAEECLDKGFNDSGLALQDIVNEIGRRLSFEVIPGLYRGNRVEIGFDGIWHQEKDWSLVIEVKTTDAYRISLDTIATYRNRLIEEGKLSTAGSSILIVVGRNDTGELEAQIRGSRHAWDVRIISVDSLVRLMRIKESLSDESTTQKISIALRPYEFTRVDQLIELLFLAIKDIEVEERAEELPEVEVESAKVSVSDDGPKVKKFTPSSFHEPVYLRLREKLNVNFVKQTKSAYSSSDNRIGLVISISKVHVPSHSQYNSRFWFAFHPHQLKFLERFPEAYACYGCGDANTIFMIPLNFLRTRLDLMWETKSADREYKHIVIFEKSGKFFLRTNVDEKEHYDDLEKYRV